MESSPDASPPGAKKLTPLFMALTFIATALNAFLVFLALRSSDFRRIPAFINLYAIFVLWGIGYGFL